MSLDAGRYRLWNGYQTLLSAWDATQRHWRDGVSQEFDRKYLAPLAPSMHAALASLDKLEQLLSRVKQGCGE